MKNYLVADLFCGAGGSSTGAEKAVRSLGRGMTLVCINHWPVAIETHKLNHPTARHYVEDVAVADPYKIVPEGYLDLLMASPECRFYSRARGGKPVHDQGRMNPWAVLRWLTSLNVKCLLVENVPEFVNWGPLLPDGTPDPRHKGEYFQSWFFAIQKAGYNPEWRFLNAADYGDATTRTRFFLIARRDSKPIRWPEPTHSAGGERNILGLLPKWRAAREIIDWQNPGRSLLDDPKYQRRPLSENTRRRIARGLNKFGGALAPLYIRLLGLASESAGEGEARPFVIGKQGHSPSIRGVDKPIPTATADGRSCLVNPTFIMANRSGNVPRSLDEPIHTITASNMGNLYKIEPSAEPFVLGQQSQGAARSVKNPLPTVAGDGAISIIRPMMVKYYRTGICHLAEEPVPAITTKDRIGLANPMIVPFRGERDGQEPRVHDINEPVPTITSEAGFALANPAIIPYYGDHKGKKEPRAHSVEEPLKTVSTQPRFGLANPVLVEVNHTGGDRAESVDEPLGTITTKRGEAVVTPFMVQWDNTGGNGSYVRPVSSPVPTIVTKQNTGVVEPVTIGLIEPILKRLDEGDIDPQRLVLLDGEPYLLDIRFRMLTNLELARAMGFTDQETTYEFVGNISEVTEQIGNAVAVNMAAALVRAIFSPVKKVSV